jgi:histidyl-tRNA synthetase
MDYSSRSLKAQMKQAGRLKARFVLIVGEQELEKQEAVLRNMNTQQQSEFSLQGSMQELAQRLLKLIVE